MAALLGVGVLLTLIGLSQALPSSAELRLLEDLIRGSEDAAAGGGGGGLVKRDLEFNQYVPAYRLRGEPSCEELRAMWRLSKREARRATSTNQLPRSRPYSYGRLIAFAPSPHQRPFAYGEPRNFAHHHSGVSSFSPVKGSFNRLQAMLGVGAGRPGSFQRVRGLIASQRLPGESPKGKMDELRGMVLGGKKTNLQGEVGEVSPSLRSSEVYQPVRRTPSNRFNTQQQTTHSSPNEGFIGPLMPGYGPPGGMRSLIPPGNEWRIRPWSPRQTPCEDVRESICQRHSDCTCAGQYRCNKGRCKVLPAHPDLEDILGAWFAGPLSRHDLGAWGNQDQWLPRTLEEENIGE